MSFCRLCSRKKWFSIWKGVCLLIGLKFWPIKIFYFFCYYNGFENENVKNSGKFSLIFLMDCFSLISSAFKTIFLVSGNICTNFIKCSFKFVFFIWIFNLQRDHPDTCAYKWYSDILMHYSRGKSALVFCSTRKGAQEAALKLSQTAMTFGYSNPFIKDKEQQERLREASLSCSDKQLQSYILYGGMGLVCSVIMYPNIMIL